MTEAEAKRARERGGLGGECRQTFHNKPLTYRDGVCIVTYMEATPLPTTGRPAKEATMAHTLSTKYTVTNPLRLAVGSHESGSGKGCAMNVISWENGDTKITDFPDCSDPLLTRIVQRVNDTICNHRDDDLLCAPCSLIVLALGHRTVGTGKLDLTDLERRVIWVKIAADQARQVQHLNADLMVDAAILAAEAWADNPTYAAAHAANYASNASTPDQRLNLAQRAIDMFEQLTNHVAPAVDEAVTLKALESMLA